MELNNDVVRDGLELFLQKYGIKNKWVSQQINLSETSLSLFLNKKRILTQNNLQKIHNLITEG
jgi:Arc/MetJ-type ribon-helix-helix transcriptional regulator